MDFRPIEEYEPGGLCSNCWGEGKAHGDTPTPKRVLLNVSGCVGIEAICNGEWILIQDAINLCFFSFDNGTVAGVWQASPIVATFSIGRTGEAPAYAAQEIMCSVTSDNGTIFLAVSIDEPPTPEWELAYNQNISPNRPTYFQNFGSVGPDEVLMLSKRLDRIRLAIKFTPEY